ncbi:asparagine synthetase [Musa troglodytarum]|uniref:asparagine synthase (glutamine-hydrolyzing) n=1 Tax=Musa troglodytarum TaxID=320322 RepID=A0A9E7G953_9LILI|nr:asparagine synthetase [Musa troglodytarum]
MNECSKGVILFVFGDRLRHRGPDWSGLHQYGDCYLAHQRLAIIDPASGDQPLYNEDKTIVVTVQIDANPSLLQFLVRPSHNPSSLQFLVLRASFSDEREFNCLTQVNGEIYNHEELRNRFPHHKFRTGSDCEVIAHLVKQVFFGLIFPSPSRRQKKLTSFYDPQYEEHGEGFVDMLDGIFSFVLLDTRDNSFIAARDAIGITPLYIGWGLDGSVWISSEMKGLNDDCEHFEVFPPGHLYSSKGGSYKRWYNPPWYSEAIPSVPYDPLVLREAFEKAVVKRLMTDVPFGVLLSGGLDSSLVAAVTSRHLAGTKAAEQWGAQLHSFCVGLEGSPDLKAAKEVADYLGTVHHEFHFTVQDGIDAIEDAIYHIETYDVTTIRASTPMFLMSRKIKALGVKMVISGEGSDELFGGYLYFHKAPNKEEFHRETCRKVCKLLVVVVVVVLIGEGTEKPHHLVRIQLWPQVKALHQYDCLRANKATSAWGLESRVPFLDKAFVDVAMSIDPEWKMIKPDLGRMEKWVLRKAFDDEENPYLPKHILYRQKEQFSDGVGYSWIDGLKAHAAEHVSNFVVRLISFFLDGNGERAMTDGVDLVQVSGKMMQNAKHIYPHNTPTTKEAYYYRMIFERFFPQVRVNSARLTVPGGPSVACSTAKAIEWDAQWSKNLDPSGRAALGVHVSAYDPAAVPASLAAGTSPAMLVNKKQRAMEAKAPELAISS